MTRPPADTETGPALFPAHGEMGERCRALDWAATPLGPVEQWPESLKTLVGLVLGFPFPMVVLWGPELVQVYNDGYRELMGTRHPAGLGQPTRECWPEVWHLNEPIYERVWAGESVSLENPLLPVTRSGRLEDASFTLSYSPVRGEGGEVAGVLVTVLETADRVREERRHREAEASLRESEARYRTLFTSIDEGFCVIQVLFDAQERPVDYRFLEGNPAWERHTGLYGAIGRTAREVIPGLEEHWFQIYGGVALTGQPTRFESGSEAMRRWFDVFAFRMGDPAERKVAILFTNVTEQKKARDALRRSEERYALAARATGNAVWDWDLTTDEVEWTREITEVFGHPAATVEPTPAWWHGGIHPDEREAVVASIRAVIGGAAGGRGWREEYRFRRGDGSYAVVSDTGYVVRDDEGRAVRMVGAMADVTERVRAREELQGAHDELVRLTVAADSAREMAERASQAKGQFLAVMSHELRTPLTGVIGHADLLESQVLGPVDARQKEALSRIKASSWHLVSIIDEILTLSRVDAGKEVVRREPADVVEIARDVVRALEPQAGSRGLRLSLEDADAPLVLAIDPGKVRQIVMNLVGNAVKYTPGGAVAVQVDRRPGEWLQVHVRDTGPGIRPEDRERIFEAFTQVDSSHTRSGSGTGLGLAICRRLARLMGGDITLRSTPGEGSTFTLRLPWVEAGEGG